MTRAFTLVPDVHVAVPVYGATPAICQLSFGSFIGSGVAAGYVRHLGEVEGAYIDRARNDLVRQAMSNGSTHIVFIDQDMIIPEGALSRLLAHGVDCIGGTYWGKDDWFTPVSFHLDPFRRVYEFEDLPIVDTTAPLPEGIDSCACGKPDNHIHSIGGTGLGCTLITLDLFQRVAEHFEDQLWFSSKETGEDIHFATRAQEIGVERYLDGFVQCGHVRNQIVTRQHYDWARQNAPKCDEDGCERAAFWDVKDADTADSANRCWKHMYPDEKAEIPR